MTRGCHVQMLDISRNCTKCTFSLWSPWWSLGVWLGKKLEDTAPGYDVEMNRKIPRISLRVFHKAGTILFLIALLWLKKCGREVGGCSLEEVPPLGFNHHLVWNQAVFSEKFRVWALFFSWNKCGAYGESPPPLPPPFKSWIPRRFQSGDAARGSVFISYAAVILCCEMAPPAAPNLSGYFIGKKFPGWAIFFH